MHLVQAVAIRRFRSIADVNVAVGELTAIVGGAGLDNIHSAKEGSSRVITQFLGHIVRGEPIKLVDGGAQKRCFTGISDGVDALMKIIENRNGCATRKIFNVGNPGNNYSVRELAQQMLKLAEEYPEYRTNAAKVKLIDTTAGEYYGKGYQDVSNRVPKIDNTRAELGWEPRVTMRDALKQIFDAYRGQVAEAGHLDPRLAVWGGKAAA